jgi:hypothetical protein
MSASPRLPGILSFHIRHSREAPVGRPVHVIFHRAFQPDLVEIVRVLHERIELGWHIARGDARGLQKKQLMPLTM